MFERFGKYLRRIREIREPRRFGCKNLSNIAVLNQNPERFERFRIIVENFQNVRILQDFGNNPDLCFKNFQILICIENILKTLQDLNIFEG